MNYNIVEQTVRESLLEMGERVKLPTSYGDFEACAFTDRESGNEHIALIKGNWRDDEVILVRLHSSCITGDIFGSCRCDCGSQLCNALEEIEKNGKGVIVYLNQEGRGIGLYNKMKTYKLQENGQDTIQANLSLGFKEDERDYKVGAIMLHMLKANKIRLITNNPDKAQALENYGVEVSEMVLLISERNQYNTKYLDTKKEKMGHAITF